MTAARGELRPFGKQYRPSFVYRIAGAFSDGFSDQDFGIGCGSSGVFTLDLPQASLFPGRIVAAKKIFDGIDNTGYIKFNAFAGDTIDGQTQFIFTEINSAVWLLSDGGVNWAVLSDYVPAQGWQGIALPQGAGSTDGSGSGSFTLAAAGGQISILMEVFFNFSLQTLRIRNLNTTLLRTAEWRLYKQLNQTGTAAENTVFEIAGANGTFSFTPAAASNISSTAAAPGTYLSPGSYWLVIRNTAAVNDFIIENRTGLALSGTVALTQAGTAALGATRNILTGGAKQGDRPSILLIGRLLGQTAAWTP